MINPILLKILMRQMKNGNVTIEDIKDEAYKEAAIKLFEEEKSMW